MANMFWGLAVTGESPTTVSPERPLRISRAVLASPSAEEHSFPVWVCAGEEGLRVGALPPRTPTCAVDVHLGKGETLTLAVEPAAGNVVVHLTGHYTDGEEAGRAQRVARAERRTDQLVDICNRILERTYHIN